MTTSTAAAITVTEMVMGISPYKSPRGEGSCFKRIPMRLYHDPLMREFIRNSRLRARFRGPRRAGCRGQLDCLADDATSFSLYPRA